MITLTPPIVTAATAGVLILLQSALSFAVTLVRRRVKQSLGDGGNPELLAAVRRHGNLAENAALFIAGLGLLEMLGGARLFVESLAGLFILARISHAIGLSMKPPLNPLRIAGVIVTIGVGVTLGWRLLTLAVPLLR
jgi:uncharacterized membrane protein YecN with MAPEG domain